MGITDWIDSLGELSSRARQFLAHHGQLVPRPLDRYWLRDNYACTGPGDRPVPGPDGGLDRLLAFFSRYPA